MNLQENRRRSPNFRQIQLQVFADFYCQSIASGYFTDDYFALLLASAALTSAR
jgi:hypothetical protein